MTDQLGSVRRLAVKALVSFVATAVVMSAVGSGVAVAEFEDVEGVHAPAVAALEGLGVFEGTACGEGLFCPGEPVRRWTMAVWLVRVLDESEPQAGSSRFVDVDDSEPESTDGLVGSTVWVWVAAGLVCLGGPVGVGAR